MQTVPFLTHYQLVYANFDFSSFSLISYRVKVALLKGQSAAFTTRFCSFCDILCLILHNEKAYSIHTYTHNSILTADRQKDKYCTQKVPLFAIGLACCAEKCEYWRVSQSEN